MYPSTTLSVVPVLVKYCEQNLFVNSCLYSCKTDVSNFVGNPWICIANFLVLVFQCQLQALKYMEAILVGSKLQSVAISL